MKKIEFTKKDWKEIHPDFTAELQAKWENRGFAYETCKEWINFGAKIDDYDFVDYLRNGNIIHSWVLNYVGEKLREEYEMSKRYQEESSKFSSEVALKSKTVVVEKDIASNSKLSKQIKNFEHSYNSVLYKSTTEQKSLIDQLIASTELRERYESWGLCRECHQPNTGQDWCQPCAYQRLQQSNWTSGNQAIDKFIRECQLKATDWRQLLEWIPYEQFTDIEYLAEGGFGKVYKANWIDGGPIERWDVENKKWLRNKIPYDGLVVLKSLNNSQNITADFLQEIIFHKLIDDNSYSYIVPLYGISQDPKTKDYLMVANYMNKGNLRQYLSKSRLSFYDKLNQLRSIAEGLYQIHKQGLVHRDFHAGNILNDNDNASFFITDLGLCRPANEENNEKKVYGVLPYVAPEVLTGKPYTSAADIYSFGMVAYELLSGLPPYYNLPHTETLASYVCQGLRPNLNNVLAPQSLKSLTNKCWDVNSTKRPTASEIERILRIWLDEVKRRKDSKFYKQYEEVKNAEEETEEKEVFEAFRNFFLMVNNTTCDTASFSYRTHPQAFRTSRLLDFKNLPEPQNNPSPEWQTSTLLELQINEVKEQISLLKEPLEDESKELVDNFIQVYQKMLKNEEDEQTMEEVGELEEKLKGEGITEQKIEEITRYCENLVALERQQSTQQQEAKIQQFNT